MDSGETQLRNWGCFGVLGGTRHRLGGIGSGPTVRLACRGAGRPRSRPSGTTGTAGKKPPKPRHPFRPLLRPTPPMPPTTPRRLRQHPPQPTPRPAASTKTSPPEPKVVTAPPNRQQPRTRLPNLGGRFRSPLQNPGSSTRTQFKAALARLPAPLAAQLARLATRHRIVQSAEQRPAPVPTQGLEFPPNGESAEPSKERKTNAGCPPLE